MTERNLVFIAIFTAIIAVLGLIPALSLSVGPPITAQSLGIMLAGLVLGARRGFLAVLLFVVLVALGLPLLSGGRGGIGLFFTGSAGFLVGFPIAAFVTGLIMEKMRSKSIFPASLVAAFTGCILVLYLFGVVGLAIVLDMPILQATKILGIYVPGDLVKMVIAAGIVSALGAARPEFLFSRAKP